MAYSDVILADSPILYWQLDDTSGTSARDNSGNGRNGTYNSSPILSAPGVISNGSKAVKLDGTTQYMNVADTGGAYDFAGTASFSAETWFLPSATPGSFARLFSHENAGNTQGWIVYTSSDASVRFSRNASNTGVGSILSANKVYHIVVTYDGANMLVYVNAVAGAAAPDVGALVAVVDDLAVARQSSNSLNFSAGTVDEVAIYNTALSSTKVLKHYLAGTQTLHFPNPAHRPRPFAPGLAR